MCARRSDGERKDTSVGVVRLCIVCGKPTSGTQNGFLQTSSFDVTDFISHSGNLDMSYCSMKCQKTNDHDDEQFKRMRLLVSSYKSSKNNGRNCESGGVCDDDGGSSATDADVIQLCTHLWLHMATSLCSNARSALCICANDPFREFRMKRRVYRVLKKFVSASEVPDSVARHLILARMKIILAQCAPTG